MKALIEKQRAFFLTDATKSYDFRVSQLKKLKTLITNHQDEILQALFVDLHKSNFEAYTTEVGFNLRSISMAISNLKKWMKKKKYPNELFVPFSSSYVIAEPKGVVLLIGPYNYPFQLVIEPLIGAIAAGNTVIIKPSEFTTDTEKVLEKLINTNFDEAYLKVVKGDASVTKALLLEKFDHIFFTGSTRVGQIVYQAASQYLTPVTLELGGKSPTIIDETANIDLAAERIAFAKFTNAGQTCIAPDFVYVHQDVKAKFIEAMSNVIKKRYADRASFGRIVNTGHFNRLSGLIDEKKVVFGGQTNKDDKFIQPTVLDAVTWNDPVMQEEIFGPILPLLPFTNLEDVISILKTKEKPLALYFFSEDKTSQKRVWDALSFGNGAINDALMQVASRHLPFGGVGQSGFGSYHGYFSFKTFSHEKSYIHKSTRFDLKIIYPPYNAMKLKAIKKFIK
jgi:aldehyde dehydrogenase (NAD+)